MCFFYATRFHFDSEFANQKSFRPYKNEFEIQVGICYFLRNLQPVHINHKNFQFYSARMILLLY